MRVKMTEEMFQKLNSGHKSFIERTGGLSGKYVYDNIDIFLKVYPELGDMYKSINDKVQQSNCTSCEIGKLSGILVSKILSLSSEGRNLDLLNDLPNLDRHPFLLKKLRGEVILKEDISDLDRSRFLSKSFTSNQSDISMDRPGCEDCVRKHLGKSAVHLGRALELFRETLQGYPEKEGFIHQTLALANLAEASDEIVKINPELARKIRLLRLKIMNQKV
jgi:hypothetical protein